MAAIVYFSECTQSGPPLTRFPSSPPSSGQLKVEFIFKVQQLGENMIPGLLFRER
jgi:hypothetical protein